MGARAKTLITNLIEYRGASWRYVGSQFQMCAALFIQILHQPLTMLLCSIGGDQDLSTCTTLPSKQ